MDNRQKNAHHYGSTYKEYWNGESVKVHRNGWVRLYISADRPALKFWTTKRIFNAIEESREPAVIYIFSADGVSLEIQKKVVFHKSWEYMSKKKKNKV